MITLLVLLVFFLITYKLIDKINKGCIRELSLYILKSLGLLENSK